MLRCCSPNLSPSHCPCLVGIAGAVLLPVTGVAVGAAQVVRGAANTPEAVKQAASGKQWDESTRTWIDPPGWALVPDSDINSGGAGPRTEWRRRQGGGKEQVRVVRVAGLRGLHFCVVLHGTIIESARERVGLLPPLPACRCLPGLLPLSIAPGLDPLAHATLTPSKQQPGPMLCTTWLLPPPPPTVVAPLPPQPKPAATFLLPLSVLDSRVQTTTSCWGWRQTPAQRKSRSSTTCWRGGTCEGRPLESPWRASLGLGRCVLVVGVSRCQPGRLDEINLLA